MTQQECEQRITSLLEEIVKVYTQYNPNGAYLSMCYIKDDTNASIHANNRNWREDGDDPAGDDYLLGKAIDIYKRLEDN